MLCSQRCSLCVRLRQWNEAVGRVQDLEQTLRREAARRAPMAAAKPPRKSPSRGHPGPLSVILEECCALPAWASMRSGRAWAARLCGHRRRYLGRKLVRFCADRKGYDRQPWEPPSAPSAGW